MKSKFLNYNIFILTIIFIYLVQTNSRKIIQSNKIKVKNFKYAQVFLDKINQKPLIKFHPYSSLSINMTAINLFTGNITKTRILLEDIVISDRAFGFLYSSNQLQKLDFPQNTQYRTRKMRIITEYIANRYQRNSINCIFFLTKNFESAFKYKSKLHLDLNSFCFHNNSNMKLFEKSLKKNYQSFIRKKENVLKLNFLDRSKINHLKVKSVHLNHLNNRNGNRDDTSFLQYSRITYTKEGIVITDADRPNSINHVKHSFNYENIKDCELKKYSRKNSENKKNSESKCCFKFNYDFKDVFKNEMAICSDDTKTYICDIKQKFIKETIIKNCLDKVRQNILFVYNSFKNSKEILIDSSSNEIDFLYRMIYEFILRKNSVAFKANLQKKDLIKRKLANLIEGLGNDFIIYIKSFKLSDFLLDIVSKIDVPSYHNVFNIVTNGLDKKMITLSTNHFNKKGIFSPHNLNQEYDPKLKLDQVKLPDYVQIFETCSKHPNLRKCICAAFPFSSICAKHYCKENLNSSFCSKTYCKTKRNDKTNCSCYSNTIGGKCKCQIYGNFDKECYCKKYKNSVFCEENFCQNNSKSNHLFCLCERNQSPNECKKDYCRKNKNDKRCKCLINPNSRDCICESATNLKECKGKKDNTQNKYNDYIYIKNKKNN